MSFWKPIAVCAVIGMALFAGISVTNAAGGCHEQPNMSAALEALRSAKASLEKAEHNKGGWREAALKATEKAIAETERGCNAADKK